jgi:hypothetical protein
MEHAGAEIDDLTFDLSPHLRRQALGTRSVPATQHAAIGSGRRSIRFRHFAPPGPGYLRGSAASRATAMTGATARVDFYFVAATDCASASLHWSLTLPILFRMQLRSLPGQLSFTSVVQALLISATRASLALHASENSAACVFTQSLMRPPPGLFGRTDPN